MTDEDDNADARPFAHLEDRPSENTAAMWLAVGFVVSVIGGALYAATGETFVGYLGLAAAGLGGIALAVGAVGYGVLLALRQHHRETGGS